MPTHSRSRFQLSPQPGEVAPSPKRVPHPIEDHPHTPLKPRYNHHMSAPTPPELPYTIERRGIASKDHAIFACPSCGEQLHAPLSRAGKPDKCAMCSAKFILPGATLIEQREHAMAKVRRDAALSETALHTPAAAPANTLTAESDASHSAVASTPARSIDSSRLAAAACRRASLALKIVAAISLFGTVILLVFWFMELTAADAGRPASPTFAFAAMILTFATTALFYGFHAALAALAELVDRAR